VKANQGAPGVDGMTLRELAKWIEQHKQTLIASLLEGSYQPQAVRGVEIPKSGGGMRQWGIPTVVDRLVQQAILQVLEPILDPTFSASVLDAGRMTPWPRRATTWPKAARSSWISTWRNSSTG
jgi:RNA-directed DNA polymerase